MWICVDARPLQEEAAGGVKEYAKNLLSALLRLDKKNQYALFTNCFFGSSFINEYAAPNVFHASFKYPNKLFNAALFFAGAPRLDMLIERQISEKIGRKIKLDIFWAPNINFIRLKKETKFFLTVHDLSFLAEPPFFNLKQRAWHALTSPRRLIERADCLLPVSDSTRADLGNLALGQKKCRVIYPGVSDEFLRAENQHCFEAKRRYNLPERFILAFASLGRRKNLEGVIDAFGQARLPADTYLAVAGTGTERLRWRSARNSRILFLGAVPSEFRPALYRAAQFFVYPSFYEGFGLPVLEAMASGAPVITSSSTSLPEAAGGAALLVDSHDLSELRSAMEILSRSPELRFELSRKGLLRAANFNWESSAAALAAQFEI